MSILSSFRAFRSRYATPARGFIWALKGLAVFHLFWEFGYVMSRTQGPSMLPTFELMGDWAIVEKSFRRGRGIRVGDLVVYDIPIERVDQGIKRVIGMPGDYVLINSPESGSSEMIQVPRGHCWIVGDNLPASRDSRHFGPIPLALVHGKAVAKTSYWFDLQILRNPLQRPSPEP